MNPTILTYKDSGDSYMILREIVNYITPKKKIMHIGEKIFMNLLKV
jgi:hypothetical protein